MPRKIMVDIFLFVGAISAQFKSIAGYVLIELIDASTRTIRLLHKPQERCAINEDARGLPSLF
jgi:hypothetical protein